MTKQPSWPEFYKGRLLSEGYLDHFAKQYEPFLSTVKAGIKVGDRVVEIGCGLATTTKVLKDSKDRPWCGFHCYDISPDMVRLARFNLGFEGPPVDRGDARLPTGCCPDVIHSHGVLEHLSDEDIKKVIEAHRTDGIRVAVHYVPGSLHGKPSFGDERLLTIQYWRTQFDPAAAFSFNDEKDYVLVWRF